MNDLETTAAHTHAALELATIALGSIAATDPVRIEASVRATRIVLQDHRLATPPNPMLILAYEKVLDALEGALKNAAG